MLHTRVCDLLEIDHPVIQAPIGPWATAELAAAASNAGGLGSIATVLRSPDELQRQFDRIRELTERPFAVNHVLTSEFNEDAFDITLEIRPAAITLALGDPGPLVERAHDAGILVMQQVHSVRGARRAAELGVDIIIAQGSEAGGNSGDVAALPLIPQVVDAVRPVPVIAAGGIADGRGLAAALALGAEGVYLGTRFMASTEARVSDAWKQAILAAASEDAVKVPFWNDLYPPAGGDYATVPRALRTPFIDEWMARPEEARQQAARLRTELLAGARAGRMHEYVPLTGQTAGLIHDVLPAREIVRRIVADAAAALKRAAELQQ